MNSTVTLTVAQKKWFEPLLQISREADLYYRKFEENATLFNTSLMGSAQKDINLLSHGFSMVQSLQAPLKRWLEMHKMVTSMDMKEIPKTEPLSSTSHAEWCEVLLDDHQNLYHLSQPGILRSSLIDIYQQHILKDLYDIQRKACLDWNYSIDALHRYQKGKQTDNSLKSLHGGLSETRSLLENLIGKIKCYLSVFYVDAWQAEAKTSLDSFYQEIQKATQYVVENTRNIEGVEPDQCVYFFMKAKKDYIETPLGEKCTVLETVWSNVLSNQFSNPMSLNTSLHPSVLKDSQLSLRYIIQLEKQRQAYDLLAHSLVAQFEKHWLDSLFPINQKITNLREYFLRVIYQYNCAAQAAILSRAFGEVGSYQVDQIRFIDALHDFKNSLGYQQLEEDLGNMIPKYSQHVLKVAPEIKALLQQSWLIRKSISENYYMTFWMFDEFFKNISQGKNTLHQMLLVSHRLSGELVPSAEKLNTLIVQLAKAFPRLYQVQSENTVDYYLTIKPKNPDEMNLFFSSAEEVISKAIKKYEAKLDLFYTPLYQISIELIAKWVNLAKENYFLLSRAVGLIQCQSDPYNQPKLQIKVMGMQGNEYNLLTKLKSITFQLDAYSKSHLFDMHHALLHVDHINLRHLIEIKRSAIVSYQRAFECYHQFSQRSPAEQTTQIDQFLEGFDNFKKNIISSSPSYFSPNADYLRNFYEGFSNSVLVSVSEIEAPLLHSNAVSEHFKRLCYQMVEIWKAIISNIDQSLNRVGKIMVEKNKQMYLASMRNEHYLSNHQMMDYPSNRCREIFAEIMDEGVQELIEEVKKAASIIKAKDKIQREQIQQNSMQKYTKLLQEWGQKGCVPSASKLVEEKQCNTRSARHAR